MSRVRDERDSFCKLILRKEPTQHLRIPPEFSRLYRHELPDTVILKGPSGNEWPAKLCQEIDYVYIEDDGWRNFHRDNALGNSEFLIFQYDGKNCFEVQVFDPTGVERLNVAGAKSMRINNPKHPVGSQNLPLLKSPNSQGKHNPELEQNKLEKIQVEESLSKSKEEEMDLPDVRTSSEPSKHKCKNKQRQVKAGKLAPHFPVCKSRFLRHSLEKNASSSKETARLGAVKETFTSNFPFFMSYMRRSTVEKAKLLPVPSKFAKHFPAAMGKHCLTECGR
ncbi:B3 domain-containing protein At2g35310-like [Syzygium oleosum]|uniref:B3 domain-containing protein At2g35310-like n=1 Tax=Syzygium oleosum TaxID=219896 RepID=UPI0011D292D6|nr:B3 domain-containing protein At2g35310-like [Syzygium oleosum]